MLSFSVNNLNYEKLVKELDGLLKKEITTKKQMENTVLVLRLVEINDNKNLEVK